MNQELDDQKESYEKENSGAVMDDQLRQFRQISNSSPPSRNNQSSWYYGKALTQKKEGNTSEKIQDNPHQTSSSA